MGVQPRRSPFDKLRANARRATGCREQDRRRRPRSLSLTPARSSLSSTVQTATTRQPWNGYADATLIALAQAAGVSVIATVDQRDFSVYRIARRKRFR
jgi:predicted nucleic acid-binding protein